MFFCIVGYKTCFFPESRCLCTVDITQLIGNDFSQFDTTIVFDPTMIFKAIPFIHLISRCYEFSFVHLKQNFCNVRIRTSFTSSFLFIHRFQRLCIQGGIYIIIQCIFPDLLKFLGRFLLCPIHQ